PNNTSNTPALIKALDDKGYRRHETAIKELVALGGSAVPALIQALEDENLHIRYWAVRAIQHIGKPAESAVPALLHLLQQGTPLERPDLLDLHLRAATADALEHSEPVLRCPP